MQTLYQILAILGAGLIVWVLYMQIKNHPEVFSRANMSKSFSTLGILALILIAFVFVLVCLVRAA